MQTDTNGVLILGGEKGGVLDNFTKNRSFSISIRQILSFLYVFPFFIHPPNALVQVQKASFDPFGITILVFFTIFIGAFQYSKCSIRRLRYALQRKETVVSLFQNFGAG
jgi:hypothetical protein